MRIGIDLGGTKIAVGAVDEGRRIVAKRSIPTGGHRPVEEVARDIAATVNEVLKDTGLEPGDLTLLGVGSPGECDTKTGTVIYLPNLGWRNAPLRAELQKYFSRPIALGNDADCAALGEALAGAARGYTNVVLITLGTGVGGGLVIDNKIYSGMNGYGAEPGHMVLHIDGEPCSCGHRGCFEAYASVTALIRQCRAALQQSDAASTLRALPPDGLNGKTIFDAAQAGDELALGVVHRYTHYLSEGLISLSNIFAPDIIIIGGGLSGAGEFLLEPVRREVYDGCYGGSHLITPHIVRAELGNDAGIIGAAFLR